MRPPISVRIHDSHLGIWQDDARDETLRSEIYAELIRRMRSRGWFIRRDPRVYQHYRCLSANNRLGARGTLRCAIEIAGRTVKLEFWSTTSKQDNRNGRRYDFDKLARMNNLDQLRVRLEFDRILSWLGTLANVTIERSDDKALSPMQRIERDYAESWHKDKDLGRPTPRYDSNRESKNGSLLEQGQTVWFADAKGRIIRGSAYYNINNMWWVIAGGKLHNESSKSLHTVQPDNLRVKRNERELAVAIERMDFLRANRLKSIIFGCDPIFMIWARDHSAYYRSQYAGYTTDRIQAGKYTRAEAEAECRRVPDKLEMVCPDGNHVRFKDQRSEVAA